MLWRHRDTLNPPQLRAVSKSTNSLIYARNELEVLKARSKRGSAPITTFAELYKPRFWYLVVHCNWFDCFDFALLTCVNFQITSFLRLTGTDWLARSRFTRHPYLRHPRAPGVIASLPSHSSQTLALQVLGAFQHVSSTRVNVRNKPMQHAGADDRPCAGNFHGYAGS